MNLLIHEQGLSILPLFLVPDFCQCTLQEALRDNTGGNPHLPSEVTCLCSQIFSSAWPDPSCSKHLGSKPVMGDLCVCVSSLSFPPFQIKLLKQQLLSVGFIKYLSKGFVFYLRHESMLTIVSLSKEGL